MANNGEHSAMVATCKTLADVSYVGVKPLSLSLSTFYEQKAYFCQRCGNPTEIRKDER
jgi:hypothetical protein